MKNLVRERWMNENFRLENFVFKTEKEKSGETRITEESILTNILPDVIQRMRFSTLPTYR